EQKEPPAGSVPTRPEGWNRTWRGAGPLPLSTDTKQYTFTPRWKPHGFHLFSLFYREKGWTGGENIVYWNVNALRGEEERTWTTPPRFWWCPTAPAKSPPCPLWPIWPGKSGRPSPACPSSTPFPTPGSGTIWY